MDREPSVSDEDDDLETLVPQNHTKPPSPSSRSRAPFGISGLRPALPSSAASLGRSLWSRRYLLICVSLPVLFIILFFSLGGASSLPASIRLPSASSAADPAASRMREAELHALYLLRSQRSGLLSLFNRTAAPTNTSTSTPVSLSDLQAALLSQIKINREIQEALLSTHHSGVRILICRVLDAGGRICCTIGRQSSGTLSPGLLPRGERNRTAAARSISSDRHRRIALLWREERNPQSQKLSPSTLTSLLPPTRIT